MPHPQPTTTPSFLKGALSLKAQTLIVYLALSATVLAWVSVCFLSILLTQKAIEQGSWGIFLSMVFGLVVTSTLLYGNLTHQLASLGYLKLQRTPPPFRTTDTQSVYDTDAPPIVFLIPSYKENLRLVRYAMLSTALQAYPNRRIVLLIDDPPYPTKKEDLEALVDAQQLPNDLSALLARQAHKYEQALDDFQNRLHQGQIDHIQETQHLIELYRDVVAWFCQQAASIEITDHMDRLFVEGVLLKRVRSHTTHIEQLQENSHDITTKQLTREYRRLAALFRVELTSFNRKQFLNLSHELNKAMNLNSYIGLIGHAYRMVSQPHGITLEASDAPDVDLIVPDAKYIIVLDADSMLMPNYALNLIHTLERPENNRLAVAQSPYIAIPEAPGHLERMAATTVAIQYAIHLGFTQYDAVYWVGANAILRKEALDDICMSIEERGYPLKKYIQDRTHIEDTESTIDLVERGWTLYNSPEQYAYSVTPHDFGSLLIQRRRWANGGLIVLPRLIRYLCTAPKVPHRWLQGIMRVGYLMNLSIGSLAVLATLFYPLPPSMITFLIIGGLAHLLVYCLDLCRMGGRLRDLPHLYALNLMLVPINLGGAGKSLRQVWTRQKTPFKRTPTSGGVTAIPPLYLSAEYTLMFVCLFIGIFSLSQGRTMHALWSFINVAIYIHIIINFMHNTNTNPQTTP